MPIVALDGTKLIVLMLAGGAFALAGLWLMFRPQPEGEAARIELFGLKFQASSAGLLVFLIGAAFLAVPIFVPERPAADRRAGAAAGGTTGRSDAATTLPPGDRRPGQIAIETAEAEPNDTIASANLVSLGSVIRGELSRGDVDFFAIDVPEGVRGDVVASIHVSDTQANLQLFDDAGKPLSDRDAGVGYISSNSVERSIQRPRYFIAARNLRRDPGSYTLTVAVRER